MVCEGGGGGGEIKVYRNTIWFNVCEYVQARARSRCKKNKKPFKKKDKKNSLKPVRRVKKRRSINRRDRARFN